MRQRKRGFTLCFFLTYFFYSREGSSFVSTFIMTPNKTLNTKAPIGIKMI